jgi:hypothetical protein
VELAITDRHSDEFVGAITLHSFGARSASGRPSGSCATVEATEGVSFAVDWGFRELNLHRVEIFTLPALPNIDRVLALARRLGFRAKGVMRELKFER